MKKILLLICSCVLLIGGIVVTCTIIQKNKVDSFNLSDYKKYINSYYYNNNVIKFRLDPITSSENLKMQAEAIWIKSLGEEIVQNRKPFAVFYDSENDAWLVEGTLPPNYMGGGPHLIVLSDGEVLAAWIDK